MKKSESDEIGIIRKIEIPNVVGKTEAQAKKELGLLDVVIRYVEDEKKENGVVVSQSIKPRMKVDEYSEIVIKVNRKEEKQDRKSVV